MLRVEVDQEQAASVELREGTGKTGNNYSFKTQPISVWKPKSKYPVEIFILLPDGVQQYPVGDYTLDLEEAFMQGSFQAIALDSRKLVLKPKK